MAERKYSIKATGGDYATIQAWADDLNNAAKYDAGDDAIGELYNEEYSLTAAVTISLGSGIPLNSVKLRAEANSKHNGTANTGARVKLAATIRAFVLARVCDLEDFEINCNGTGTPTAGSILLAQVNGCTARRLIIHDWTATQSTTAARTLIATSAGSIAFHILNCVVYDCTLTNTSTGGLVAYHDQNTTTVNFLNNTFYKITLNGGSGGATGFQGASAFNVIKNNIILDVGGTTSGAKKCFDFNDGDDSNNMSSDLTADDGGGAGCVTSAVAADQFTSIADGSEDFRLKTGSDAIDAGVDLVTTPTGVNIDILGRDRDAEADTWDMGAHEWVSDVVPPPGGSSGGGLLLLGCG